MKHREENLKSIIHQQEDENISLHNQLILARILAFILGLALLLSSSSCAPLKRHMDLVKSEIACNPESRQFDPVECQTWMENYPLEYARFMRDYLEIIEVTETAVYYRFKNE